jgi:hypothetical protein
MSHLTSAAFARVTEAVDVITQIEVQKMYIQKMYVQKVYFSGVGGCENPPPAGEGLAVV